MKSRAQHETSVILPSLKHNAGVKSVPAAFSGVTSVGAPTDVLKWQVEMYDLARQLKAELDTKIVAVQKLTSDYNRAAERLNLLIAEAHSLDKSQDPPLQLAKRLVASGCTLQQVSIALCVPQDQLESWLKAEHP